MSDQADPPIGIPRKTVPPKTEEEVLARALDLAGQTLGSVARSHFMRVPESTTRSKGWAGQLLERALGATAGSKAAPDFEQIGVEMKSLPVDRLGTPLESTYVCTVPLDGAAGGPWEESWVCKKLSRVLWVPILSERSVPIGERLIGTPFLWSPSVAENTTLQQDWEMLMDMILQGEIGRINGKLGDALHIRPKAAKASDKKWTLGQEGEWVQANPRGFYLRASFTRGVLHSQLALPSSSSSLHQ